MTEFESVNMENIGASFMPSKYMGLVRYMVLASLFLPPPFNILPMLLT